MAEPLIGRILAGNEADVRKAYEAFARIPVDWDLTGSGGVVTPRCQRTIARTASASGPGTFFGKHTRTLTVEPTDLPGWWLERQDHPDCLPVRVSIRNVWTTGDIVSNIVLRAGPPHNYIRMVEHIVALKMGLGIDNLMIRMDSGDPPLFSHGSLDLIQAIESAGVRETDRPVAYYTVTEPVTVGGPYGSFVTLLPCDPARPLLELDCAIDFKTAIGQQRIRFPLTPEHFKMGAEARTNTSALKMFYCRTIGKLFADIRNLGYTQDNILIAGRDRYYNEPRLMHDGKSLEAVWHRSTLDLLAALALIEDGLFVGKVVSFKAGHHLDVRLVTGLYKQNLLRRVL